MMMFLPKVIFMEDISSCCSHVVIESHGAAAQHQAAKLGEYRIEGVREDRPVYKQLLGDSYLFYQAGIVTGQGLWMAGPSLGQFSGGLASVDNSLCVEQVSSAPWRYADGQAWRPDSGLVVTCKDKEGPVQ